MQTEKITIHEALTRLKTIDKKINKKITSFSPFSTGLKNSNKNSNGIEKEEFRKDNSSLFQSINDLIRYKYLLKTKIAESNVNTKIVFQGRQITVNEAIFLKEQYNKEINQLLTKIVSAKNAMQNFLNFENDKVESTANKLIEDKKEMNSESIISFKTEYMKNFSLELISSTDIEKFIINASDLVEEMLSELNSKLSVSNAITTIEV